MALDWGLLGNPVNPLQALQAYGMAQQQQREQIQQQQDNEFKRQQFELQNRKYGLDAQKAQLEPFGQAAMAVLRLPEKDRPTAWDGYVDQFVQQGHPEAIQLKGRYSEQGAKAILAQTGHLDDYTKSLQPHYVPVQAGGTLVDTNNPQALSEFTGTPVAAAPVTKQIGSQTYYQVNGEWYDNPEGN